MKDIYYIIPIETHVFIRRIKEATWKQHRTVKENSFCQSQINAAEKVAFPVDGYITYRFHDWFCSVEKSVLKEKFL